MSSHPQKGVTAQEKTNLTNGTKMKLHTNLIIIETNNGNAAIQKNTLSRTKDWTV